VGSAAAAGALAAAVAVVTTTRGLLTNDAGTVEVVRGLDPLAGAAGAALLGAVAAAWGMTSPDGVFPRGWAGRPRRLQVRPRTSTSVHPRP
jgi:hypothetical protein